MLHMSVEASLAHISRMLDYGHDCKVDTCNAPDRQELYHHLHFDPQLQRGPMGATFVYESRQCIYLSPVLFIFAMSVKIPERHNRMFNTLTNSGPNSFLKFLNSIVERAVPSDTQKTNIQKP